MEHGLASRLRTNEGATVKRFLIISALALLLGVTVLSFLPGYGPTGPDYSDESAGVTGPLSYFKTPESAIMTLSQLMGDENWQKLSEFYEQGQGAPDYQSLLDGSHFRTQSPDRTQVRPFAPEYRWLETRMTDHEDIYEVIVGTNSFDGPGALAVVYLKRYPRGYRILAEGSLPAGDAVD